MGILEVVESYKHGIWLAKSSEFFGRPVIQFLGQIRIVPDLILILGGAVPLAIFLFTGVLRLKRPAVADGESIFPEGEGPPEL